MAETLTVNTEPDTLTTVESPEGLTPDEQDSLEIGTKLVEEQEQLLAGKYKNAEDLESAYISLQKKLGEKSDEPVEDKAEEPEPEPETDETRDVPNSDILDRLWDEAVKGEKYSKETLDELQGMSTGDLASLHLQYRQQAERKGSARKDFSEKDVTQLQAVAGGSTQYNDMMKWAQSNLTQNEINMFDSVMEQGNPLAAFFAVKALSYRYDDAVGRDGRMITGKPPKQNQNVFRSQAELVKAMDDPRYEKDPAYRQDIMQKLERSNMDF